VNRHNAIRRQTALAWGRTSLAASGFGIALMRVGVVHRSVVDLIAAAGLLLCGLLLAVRGRVLYVRTAPNPATPALRLVTAVALIVSAMIAVIGLT
jgi:uncharacterized membrane protein YidH (DUF202 family)